MTLVRAALLLALLWPAAHGRPWASAAARHATGHPAAAPGASPAPAAAPRAVLRVVTGTASWGDGWTGVVTRERRGTPIRVCGPLGCWSGRSVGYGPAAWTGRVADLSRAVFAAVCGPPSIGLCRVTLEVSR